MRKTECPKEFDEFRCFQCGFYDLDLGACTCSSMDMWYACPQSEVKPEDFKTVEEVTK